MHHSCRSMKLAADIYQEKQYILPHYGVLKPGGSTTMLRVVFIRRIQ